MSELLKINVNDHTERKNGLTYLSWAWAWAEVLKIDPAAEWHPQYFGPETNQVPYCQLPDGSMMVGVRLTIKGNPKQCLLPVMDHRNKAIKNPDAFAVNTALMRCLAKCIAMHGLGLYIYAGEDLPEDGRRDELKALAQDMLDANANGYQLRAIRAWYDPQSWAKDNEVANEEKKFVWGLLRECSELRSAIKANDPANESANQKAA